jgi:hypothetical protein
MLAYCPSLKQQSQSKFDPNMKNLFALLVIVVPAIFCSCQKQTTEEEIRAMVKQEVQQQIAAEREAQEKELAQRRAQFNARRNALLDKKGAAGNTLAPGSPRGPIRPVNPATALTPGTVRRPQLPPGVTLPERGNTLPEFSRSRAHGSMPAESAPATEKSLAVPSGAPAGSESQPVSPLPEATAESVSPTPTPGADGTTQ